MLIVIAAFASFFAQVYRLRRRQAVELPAPDWSTCHTGLAHEGEPPARSSHTLVDSRLALTVLLLWLPGLPLLIAGIAGQRAHLVATGAALLLGGTLANIWHGCIMIARARR